MSLKDSDDTEADKLERIIQQLVTEIIKKRECAMVSSMNSNTTDYLGMLLKANHDTAGRDEIIFEEIIDEYKMFCDAGQETTQTLLSRTISLLALHTDWQDKAREEMSMIINETLRLYPPTVATARKVKKETRLGKFTLPEGTRMGVPVRSLHHDSKIWGEDTHLFKPERGIAEVTNGNPSAFLPFSLGP
ncbi:PREDICTED: cytochrome P450 CYP749A22-like [Nicotiana attenuata]|uniref:cytochrome P450 CYP749A22-like n=1 Tax=Nicotiana attenuata TaxID=49451 RepID=UPI0009055763|nr:PREDICTED: cytochrome P450 CYP749A22-like [Nicotiana attenuata]